MPGIALVTGGSRGIGAQTCVLLGEAGWAVAVNYRADREAALKVVAEVEAAGGKAIAVQADTSVEADVLRMFETVDKDLGTLTGLVNNAGVSPKLGAFATLERADMERVLAINVIGPMLCAREAVKRMSTAGGGKGGVIVNISSGSSNGAPGAPVLYSVSKGAVNSLTIAMSLEHVGQGIRVNTVSPGLTRTEMPGLERVAATEASLPMGRAAEPQEIAEGIVWMLSEKASYVSGAYLRIGGGRLG